MMGVSWSCHYSLRRSVLDMIGIRETNNENELRSKSLFVFRDVPPGPPTSWVPPRVHPQLLCRATKTHHEVSWLVSLRTGGAFPLPLLLVFLPIPHLSIKNDNRPTSLKRGEEQKAGGMFVAEVMVVDEPSLLSSHIIVVVVLGPLRPRF